MLKAILFALLFYCVIPIFAQREFKPIIPDSYVARKTQDPIHFDGKADEADWLSAEWTNTFIEITGGTKPYFDTRVKILWDDNFIYFYAELEEKHVWADIENRDEVIFYNNDFEIFMKPYEEASHYCEVEVNALGTVWDLLLLNAYREGGPIVNDWNMDGIEIGIHVDGTLNNPNDEDSLWSVEIGLPWSSLDELLYSKKHKIVPDPWRLNFSRVQWEHKIVDGKYSRVKTRGKMPNEQNWVWTKQSAVDMHRPEHWGYLYFTDLGPDADVDVFYDPLEPVRQYLYEVYRLQKSYYVNGLQTNGEGVYAHHLEQLDIPYFLVQNDTLNLTLVTTSFGYELSADAYGEHFIINEQGRLKQLHQEEFVIAAWMHADKTKSDQDWKDTFEKAKLYGFTDLYIGGGAEELKRYVSLTKELDLNIHGWVWTLNRPGDTIARQHPDWYAVNRNGQNSLEYNAYVGYYQWLSPFSEGAREHIKANIAEIAQIEGLESVHLDYVRYCDVILGRDLQPKYDLKQDSEMPEYDYGYHPNARKGFKELFGYDPLDLEFPELSTEWRQFRLNAVTDLVNELAEIVHGNNKKISAAVFPFPLMSRTMVRQDWPAWDLDMVLPMLYHNFYLENLNWIGFATEQGVRELKEGTPLYAGLYVPALTPNQLSTAINNARSSGAKGISLFEWNALSEDHLKVLRSFK